MDEKENPNTYYETIEEVNILGEKPWGRVDMTHRYFMDETEVDKFLSDFSLKKVFYRHIHHSYEYMEDAGSVPEYDERSYWVLKGDEKIGHLTGGGVTHPEMFSGQIDSRYNYRIILVKDGEELDKYGSFETLNDAEMFVEIKWLDYKYDEVKYVPYVRKGVEVQQWESDDKKIGEPFSFNTMKEAQKFVEDNKLAKEHMVMYNIVREPMLKL